ncbi:hypothetical protein [Puniceibacterium sp. IMCC21224]|uniref:hypothetical protein n=1 Tax=Puniceibacterium sp. IMCC21224 TaxID=1618204 RepID=UPI00064DC1DF|nr:hypothetical protein [Puniceibacterium sp. IMCC21224]KMK63797.1 hypothetical protein IMCC21224_1932 [Puniceibacterium sp. IMCC21224]
MTGPIRTPESLDDPLITGAEAGRGPMDGVAVSVLIILSTILAIAATAYAVLRAIGSGIWI